MRAACYEKIGPASDVLKLEELASAEPGAGEVRVRVHCSGVNPSDAKTRGGARGAMKFPRIVPHSDGAGVIDAVGPGVTERVPGERVWIWNGAWGRADGTAAEYITLPAEQTAPLLAGTSMAAGACLGIPALTACHAVVCHGGVRDQRVLVTGGAGAVGSCAIQIARNEGARQIIATVSSPEKARLALADGADATIDYRREDVGERVQALTDGEGVERVIEVDLAANAAASIAALRQGGLIVAYGSGAPEAALPFFPAILNNVQVQFFIVYNLPQDARSTAIDRVQTLLERGALDLRIAAQLPLERIVEAHEQVESGTAVGNVVLEIA